MNTVDTKKLAEKIDKFASDRDWDQFHSIKNLSMALNVEASELLEIFQWMNEDRSNNLSDDPKAFSKVEEELADIFIYLVRIADKLEIDLESVAHKKIAKNSEKYPVSLSKGNSKKYTDL